MQVETHESEEMAAALRRRRNIAACDLLRERLFRCHPNHAPDEMKNRLLPVIRYDLWPKDLKPLPKKNRRTQPSVPVLAAEMLAQPSKPIYPSVRDIQGYVCFRYNIRLSELCSQRRDMRVVTPRHIAIYLCKIITDRSFPDIGRRFGGRDHTTCLHAVRKITKLVENDADFACLMQQHEREIVAAHESKFEVAA